jgi:hypothetical protein
LRTINAIHCPSHLTTKKALGAFIRQKTEMRPTEITAIESGLGVGGLETEAGGRQ